MPGVRPANTWYDGHFEVPTLDEILVLVETLVATLRRHHLDRPNAPLFGQSFETGTLRTIASLASVPLVQLVDAEGAPYDRVASGDPRTHATLVSPTGLAEVAGYAMGIGVHTSLVCPHTALTSGLVETAHAEGLVVHAWTVRDENCFLDPAYRIGDDPSARGDAAAQTRVLLDAGGRRHHHRPRGHRGRGTAAVAVPSGGRSVRRRHGRLTGCLVAAAWSPGRRLTI